MHAPAAAIDPAGFTLFDDTSYTIFDDWEVGVAMPLTPGSKFYE